MVYVPYCFFNYYFFICIIKLEFLIILQITYVSLVTCHLNSLCCPGHRENNISIIVFLHSWLVCCLSLYKQCRSLLHEVVHKQRYLDCLRQSTECQYNWVSDLYDLPVLDKRNN